MKILSCGICGEEYQVDDEVEGVVCGQCLITGEAAREENGIHYHSSEAFLKLISVGIDIWEIPGDRQAKERELTKRFNNLRKRGDSLVTVQRKLRIPWSKTKKLEGYRLLEKGWSRKDIAKELKVNLSTVSRWKALHFASKGDLLYAEEEKMQHPDFESDSGSSSWKEKTSRIRGHGAPQIHYRFSAQTLRMAAEGKKSNENSGGDAKRKIRVFFERGIDVISVLK